VLEVLPAVTSAMGRGLADRDPSPDQQAADIRLSRLVMAAG
jgi:hypothetical protein